VGEAHSSAFGDQLRRYRRATGLSQEALAQRAGLSIDAIASLERGRRSAPHADTLRRLVQALELDAEDRDRFVQAAEPGSPRSGRDAPVIPRNLPVSLSSFVGRVEAVADLRRLLATRPPGTRLLTLSGPGGIGKTRLALETARSLVEEPPPDAPAEALADGVWLADLSALDDPSAVPTVVAAATQASTTASPSVLAALIRALAERRLLLVLDNCEHLIDACARLADALLRGCPNVVILATSREALAIPGELVYPVARLSLVEPGVDPARTSAATPGPDDVLASEAGRLFVERASAVRPEFRLTADNASAIAELCRQLDGIPLAIELAAARASAFDVHTILARLSDRFVLLRGGNRLAVPRHQTLRALVQWSYDLLSAPEQRLFARLAVFAGGWDLAAVEAVTSSEASGGASTVELLARLVDKSLVTRTADRRGRPRYVLLETLRQFAAQPLEASGELAWLQQRHASYYLALLEWIEPQIEGSRQAEHLDRLEQDIDNLRTALDRCVAIDDAAPALNVAWCLAVLAWLRGYLEEVDGRLTTLLGLPSACAAPASVRARAIVASGYVAFYRGQLERAHGLLERGLNIFRELGAPREIGQALVWFGLILDAEEDPEQARRCFGEALRIFRDTGDVFWTARAATNLGRCLGRLGQVSSAIPLLQEALALRRQLDDRRGVANTLHHLADAQERRGELLQARELAGEALAIARAVGDRFVTVRALIGLGRVAFGLDDLALAANTLEQALGLARSDGFGHELAEVAVLLGLIARDAGDSARATRLADEGLTWARRLSRRAEAARALLVLGSIAREQARPTQAEAYFRDSVALYQQVADRPGVAVALAGLASVLADAERAAYLAGAARAVLDRSGADTWTIERHELVRAVAGVPPPAAETPAWSSGRAAPLDEVVATASGWV
jgi:predicted ATPase/DNA-binding XRE family transcriptional regulator